MAVASLTQAEVVIWLRGRRLLMGMEEFRAEIERVTGEGLSYSHLVNMYNGTRPPNSVVLRYLGLERVVVYREKRPGNQPRKGR